MLFIANALEVPLFSIKPMELFDIISNISPVENADNVWSKGP